MKLIFNRSKKIIESQNAFWNMLYFQNSPETFHTSSLIFLETEIFQKYWYAPSQKIPNASLKFYTSSVWRHTFISSSFLFPLNRLNMKNQHSQREKKKTIILNNVCHIFLLIIWIFDSWRPLVIHVCKLVLQTLKKRIENLCMAQLLNSD